jgi:serine/threonine-protein kinase
VGNYPRTRTPYGCEDLVGNVSEWCQIIEGENLAYVLPGLPSLECPIAHGVVLTAVRGACFLRLHGRRMAASHRRRLSITRRNYWTGFRPAHFGSWKPGSSGQ